MPDTRSLTPEDYAGRANEQLAEVSALLADRGQFQSVRHDQWLHVFTGRMVEAGYVYGAPWAKSWLPEHGEHSADRFEFNGRSDAELDRFKALLA